MPAFVTEALPEDLSVLVFSQSPVLSDLFVHQFQQHGLEVTRKSSDLASLTHFLDSGLSSTWYKVFWIDDVEHLSIEQAKKISKIFQEIKGLSYVVTHQPYFYQGHKRFEDIGNLLTEIDVFFAQRSPYTSLLTYRDVISNELFSLNYQQNVHFLHQGKFPFDQDSLSFIKDTEVVEGVVSLSFDPRGGKRRVVVNKKPTATKMILRAIQSEFRRRFKGEEVFVQNDVRVQFNTEYKEFAVPSSISQEELVSELIVEAKFHYKPEKTESREEANSDIPRPNVPKSKPMPAEKISEEPLHIQNNDDFAKEETEREVNDKNQTPPRKINLPEENELEKVPSVVIKKAPVENSLKKQEIISKKTSVNATELRENLNSQPTTLPDRQAGYNLSPLTLSQLVPRSLQQIPTELSSSVKTSAERTHYSLGGIQESSIQIRVETPLATIPKRAPVLIPDTRIPEIKRSKIILHQFNSSLEKPVVQRPEIEIPYLNNRVADKVRNEQSLEQKRREEVKPDEEVQKKLLEKKIASLFSGTLKPQKVMSFRKPEKKTPLQILFGPETKVGKWYRAQKGIVLLAVAISITTVTLVSCFFFSIALLERQLLTLVQNFEQGSVIDKNQIDRLKFSQNLVEKQLNGYSSLVGTSIFSGILSELDVSKKLTALSQSIDDTHQSHVTALLQFLGANSGDPISTLNPGLAQADTIYKQLSLLEAELKQTETPSFFQNRFTAEQQKDFLESLSEIRREVLIGQQLTTVLPNLLNSERTRTVAVVLQDSSELRATGGFVQTVALLTITDGHISEIKMLQPDEITTSVGGEVLPPEEVTQFLGETQWFLRDGNWNPNFETSAKQIASFIEKGTGTPVTGVIGVNTLSLAKLLSAAGPVTLSEFNGEVITDKNLTERQNFYARASLSESNQAAPKPEFLSLVLKTFLEKLKALDQEGAKELVTVVSDQLKQKEITVFSSDLGVQSTLGALGWTGTIILPPCPTQLVQDQCVVSNIYQVDSNVGVNKVNYSVKKKVEQAIQVTPEKITHKRVITYENSSPTNSWPGGAYKNYIRWYVPDKAKLLAINVDGKPIESAQIKEYQDRNSKVFGVLIEIPPQTTSKVTFEYEEEPIGKQASFAFFDQKQPGTGNTPIKVTLLYDEEYVPSVIAPIAEISGDKIEFSLLGEEHSFVGVKFR